MVDSNQLNYTIRPVRNDEIGSIVELYRACEDFLSLGPQPHASREMVVADQEASTQEGGIFCGIYHGFSSQQELIGVTDFVPTMWEGQASRAFISLLMILPSYRSQGIGEHVVRWIEHRVQENPHVTSIETAVQVNNPGAVRFWCRLGYIIESGPELRPDQTRTFRLKKKPV
jgi:ribosomal protein S18 acetylase RimI-like enzyme